MIATARLQEMLGSLRDEDIVRRVLGGERELYEVIVRRHNTRLYRAIRSILGSEDEVEDVMQETYVRAYERLAQFAGHGAFAGWLLQIGVREGIARLRRRTFRAPARHEAQGDCMDCFAASTPSPDEAADRRELLAVVSRGIDSLSALLRTVFILREVEGLDTETVAASLELSAETVRVRLHRARRHLQAQLSRRTDDVLAHVYPFHLTRCDRIVEGVFEAIGRTRR